MPENTQAFPIALLAALIGPILLAGAAPPRKPMVLPAKTTLHASAEPTEAQLPPVDPAWHQNGWRAVVPHGYVIRALVPARSRPEANAPATFWLKGSVRIPILEQRARWWRVGWTHGRSGWIPAADLQPHTTFILIDVASGRVLRRLAAKGEQGQVSVGRFLWSFSDTGVTRMALEEPSAIWSNPIHASREASLPRESVWMPDRSAFFVRANSNDTGALVEVSTGAGGIRRVGSPDSRLRLAHVDAQGRMLLLAGWSARLYDAKTDRQLKQAPGVVFAIARNGAIYAQAFGPGGAPKLIRYDPDLEPAARIKGVADVYSGCVSPDGHVLALCDQEDSRIELRRADTLSHIMTLHPNDDDLGPFVHGVVGNSGGWWTVAGGEPGNSTDIVHYTPQGQRLRTWDSDGPWAMTGDGGAIFAARDSDLLVIDTARGTAQRIPYSWRPPLPKRYLPKPSDSHTPTHLDVSALTLTPDGHTLILTEWLNGDPEG